MFGPCERAFILALTVNSVPASKSGSINLVENSAVGEVSLLRLLPAAEYLLHREQLYRRKVLSLFRRRCKPRSEVVLRCDLLTILRIEVLEISLRHRPRPMPIDVPVHQRHRRLGENAWGKGDDLEFVGAELVDREVRLVLPREQNVTDSALGEGRGRTARAGVEHRDVLIERRHELL